MSQKGARAAAGSAGSARRWRRRREARPAELVGAAMKLFCERGYAATRLEDVAARAGVTKGTVYLYFANKEDLMGAVVRAAASPKLDHAEDLVDAFDGSTSSLLRMLVAFFETVLDTPYPAVAKVIVTESAQFPELARLWTEVVVERGIRLLKKIIQRGIDRGELRDVDPGAVAPLVVAPFIVCGLFKSSLALHTDFELPVAQMLAEHAEILVRGLARVP